MTNKNPESAPEDSVRRQLTAHILSLHEARNAARRIDRELRLAELLAERGRLARRRGNGAKPDRSNNVQREGRVEGGLDLCVRVVRAAAIGVTIGVALAFACGVLLAVM